VRVILVAILSFVMCASAMATNTPVDFRKSLQDSLSPISCVTIMPYVWYYGEAAAIEWATKKGYSQKTIAMVRHKCKHHQA
jgi:hypothetical protein